MSAVILYHLRPAAMPGGFSGVDVFFVISGFVVTLSVWSLDRRSFGKFLSSFYARRFKRILPALFACLFVTEIFATLVIPSAYLSQTNVRTGSNAFVGLSNLVLANQDNYFSPRVEFNPFTHTWSLGVEEQFYLLFPFFIFVFLSFAYRRKWVVGLITSAILASLISAAFFTNSSPTWAFYMLATRFWELGLGVLLSIFVSTKNRTINEFLKKGWRADIGLAVSVVLIGDALWSSNPKRFPFPGAYLAVLGTLGFLFFMHFRKTASRTSRAFANPMMLYIGLLSYSLYLWHWPVFVLFRWTVGLENLSSQVTALLITIAASLASYYFLETPIRKMNWLRGKVAPIIVIGLISAIVGKKIFREIDDHKHLLSISVVEKNAELWYPFAADSYLVGKECTVVKSTEQLAVGYRESLVRKCASERTPNTESIFAIGDSHLGAYSRILNRYVVDTGATVYLYNNGGCPFARLIHPAEAYCKPFTAAAFTSIAKSIKPNDIVFMPSLRLPRFSDQWVVFGDKYFENELFGPNSQAERQAAEAEVISALKPLSEVGARLLFEAPKPIFKVPTYRCSDWFNRTNPICAGGLAISRSEETRFRAPVLEGFVRIKNAVGSVEVWDPFPILCKSATCTPFEDGKPLFFDGDHVSAYGNDLVYSDFKRTLLKVK